ncbi:hypothetical protein [Nocardia alni]|uniref:hypothetical protein n=1 Tax=Nocardia alni TaxID=2815723 RepID=UPI001C234762|nr:hypothetical protein [Nocardia alni]
MNIGKGWKLPGANDGLLDALAGLAGDYGDEFAEILEEIVEQRKHSFSRENVLFGEDERSTSWTPKGLSRLRRDIDQSIRTRPIRR